MNKVTLFDNNFSHAYSRNNGDIKILSKQIAFDRNQIHNTIFYTDAYIKTNHADLYPNNKNIAWVLEPLSIDREVYRAALNNLKKYKYVISHNSDYINQINNICPGKGLWCEVGGCWIEEQDQKIYNKTKNISIIASSKRFTEGHMLRHNIIEKYKSNIDSIYGTGYNYISAKILGLRDYRYSIIIENELDTFTEKLIDCLITGTIPIYYGTSNVSNIFDSKGFLFIKNINDFNNIIQYTTAERYISNLKSVQINFDTSLKYINTEDLIYNKFYNILFE